MNSFLITSSNLDEGKDKALTLAKEEGIGKFDQTNLEYEKDLGIEDVRNIQKTIFLTPFKGEKKGSIY